MKNRTPAKKAGGKLSTSLIVGMLLVPVSAVAAVALVNPDAAAESEDVVAAEAVIETTTSTTVADIVVSEIASADDLALACGDQGRALVVKEADGTISPLEQAALDSLRAICLVEGLELPSPPAPDAVVQTVTVVAASTPGSDSESGSDATADDAAAAFEAEYAATVAYINKAIDNGAGGEKIAKAEQLLAEAASLADGGDYVGGMSKLAEARKAADDADRRHHDDDDDDDDHDDDDDDHDEDEDHDDDDDHDEDEEDDDEDDD